jgi:6-phosphogluconolactonase (cycloisomerase 2 family)
MMAFFKTFPASPATGKCTARPAFATPPGSGPRHAVRHPARPVVYVANELDSTVLACHVLADGTLAAAQALATVPPGVAPAACSAIRLHRNTLYVGNRGAGGIVGGGALPNTDNTVVGDLQATTVLPSLRWGPTGTSRRWLVEPRGKVSVWFFR